MWKKIYLDASELEGNRVEKKITWMPQRWRTFSIKKSLFLQIITFLENKVFL